MLASLSKRSSIDNEHLYVGRGTPCRSHRVEHICLYTSCTQTVHGITPWLPTRRIWVRWSKCRSGAYTGTLMQGGIVVRTFPVARVNIEPHPRTVCRAPDMRTAQQSKQRQYSASFAPVGVVVHMYPQGSPRYHDVHCVSAAGGIRALSSF